MPDINISKWVTQLRDNAAGFKYVESSASLQTMGADNPATPQAWIIFSGEDAGGQLSSPVLRQKITANIVVVLAVRNVSERELSGGVAELQTLQRQTKDALIGYIQDAGFNPAIYNGADVLDVYNSTIFWRMRFSTSYENDQTM